MRKNLRTIIKKLGESQCPEEIRIYGRDNISITFKGPYRGSISVWTEWDQAHHAWCGREATDKEVEDRLDLILAAIARAAIYPTKSDNDILEWDDLESFMLDRPLA